MRTISLMISWFLLTQITVSAQVSHPTPIHTIALDTSADALVFSADGTHLAIGGRDNTVRVVDVNTGNELMRSEGHTDVINSLIFSADGNQLISASDDGSIRLFDTDSGQLLQVLGSHENDVLSVAVSAENSLWASSGRDNMLNIWNTDTGQRLYQIELTDPAWQLAFDPTGRYLVSVGEDSTISLWDSANEFELAREFIGHEDTITSLTFSADGIQIITGSVDNTVRLWDLNSISAEASQVFEGHIAPVMDIGFSEDNNYLFSASIDGTIRIWNIATGHQQATLQSHDAPITAMAQNGTKLATISTDGMLNLWDIPSNDIINLSYADTVINLPELNPPDMTESSQLYIPTANIDSPLTTFPLGDNTWVIDPNEPLVGHFEGTAWLNHTGNMVMGGHSEYPDGRAGVFSTLYDIGMGDEIYVQADGIFRRYIVTNITAVDYRDIRVVMPTAHNQLTLITCDIPSYAIDQNLYYERWVVIAEELP